MIPTIIIAMAHFGIYLFLTTEPDPTHPPLETSIFSSWLLFLLLTIYRFERPKMKTFFKETLENLKNKNKK